MSFTKISIDLLYKSFYVGVGINYLGKLGSSGLLESIKDKSAMQVNPSTRRAYYKTGRVEARATTSRHSNILIFFYRSIRNHHLYSIKFWGLTASKWLWLYQLQQLHSSIVHPYPLNLPTVLNVFVRFRFANFFFLVILWSRLSGSLRKLIGISCLLIRGLGWVLNNFGTLTNAFNN